MMPGWCERTNENMSDTPIKQRKKGKKKERHKEENQT
jgi:hypothetical protein